MAKFKSTVISTDSGATDEREGCPTAEQAAEVGTLAAVDAARQEIAQGERLAQAEVSVTDGEEIVDRRILTISVAEDDADAAD